MENVVDQTGCRRLMANNHLFMSPRGLYEFQGDAVANAYLRGNMIAVVDRGLGKTVIMMALAAQLIEDGEIDLVMCIGQGNKVADKEEFAKDWADFTSLRVHRHLGTGRAQRLTKALDAGVDVVMTTYETGKIDLMRRIKTKGKSGKGARADGPLMQSLDLRHKRVLWVFDEIVKLGNRGSELYQAYEYALSQLRRTGNQQRVLGLSANPFSTEYEQSFNIGRLVEPSAMPSVTAFEERFTHGRDERGNYSYKAAARTEFAALFQTLQYRKRDSDPDVRDQIPRLREKTVHVDLEPAHRQLYEAVQGLYGTTDPDELTDAQKGQLYSAMRLVLGHPKALLNSDAELPVAIASTLGREVLAEIPSSKTKALLEQLGTLEGKQVVIFTFYSEMVLPHVAEDLRAAGYTVGVYLGDDAASKEAKRAFKAGEVQVLLSGDAGKRGLNLPEATYIIEYEPAKTFESRMQRFGRGTRITSDAPFVYGITLVSRHTIEEATLNAVLRRNKNQDTLLGDTGVEGYMDAASRREMLQEASV